jgi:hypothetical protein
VIEVLRHDHMREHTLGRQRAFDGLRRRRHSDDPVGALRTRVLRTDGFEPTRGSRTLT